MHTDIDQDSYIKAYAGGALDDHVHERIFDFGLPCDCTVSVVGVNDDGSFRVEYTTRISEFLTENRS